MKKLLLLFVVLGTATQSCFQYNEETINYPLAIRNHADSLVYGLLSCEDTVKFRRFVCDDVKKFRELVRKHNGVIVFDTIISFDKHRNILNGKGEDSSLYLSTHFSFLYRMDKSGYNTGETLIFNYEHNRENGVFKLVSTSVRRFGYPLKY